MFLRSPVDGITLRRNDGGFEIELVGKIAKLKTLPDKSESVEMGNVASSAKVVAGAGFEPATFRL